MGEAVVVQRLLFLLDLTHSAGAFQSIQGRNKQRQVDEHPKAASHHPSICGKVLQRKPAW